MGNEFPTSIVIFGASGDLTRRKLIPALFNLFRKGRLPKPFRIIGHSKTEFSEERFRNHLLEGLQQHALFEYSADEWGIFARGISYHQGGYSEERDFSSLALMLSETEAQAGNRIYYMATPPILFPSIIDLLGRTGQLAEEQAGGGW